MRIIMYWHPAQITFICKCYSLCRPSCIKWKVKNITSTAIFLPLSQPELAVNIVGLAKTVHYLERLYLEPKKTLTKIGWLCWAVRHQSSSALVRGVNTMTWVFKLLKTDTQSVFPDPSEGEARIQCTLTDNQQLVFIPVENSSGLTSQLHVITEPFAKQNVCTWVLNL